MKLIEAFKFHKVKGQAIQIIFGGPTLTEAFRKYRFAVSVNKDAIFNHFQNLDNEKPGNYMEIYIARTILFDKNFFDYFNDKKNQKPFEYLTDFDRC